MNINRFFGNRAICTPKGALILFKHPYTHINNFLVLSELSRGDFR